MQGQKPDVSTRAECGFVFARDFFWPENLCFSFWEDVVLFLGVLEVVLRDMIDRVLDDCADCSIVEWIR